MFDACTPADWLETLNYLVVIGGVAVAVWFFPKKAAQEETLDRERSYRSLNDQFLRFLELQLANPGLGTNTTDREPVWDQLSDTDRKRQVLLFDYLASVLERAQYFLCNGPVGTSEWGVEQWKTWEHWLDRYLQNPNFVRFWQHLAAAKDEASYGEQFMDLVRAKLNRSADSAAA